MRIVKIPINLTPKNIFLWIIIISILLLMFVSASDVSRLYPQKPLSNLIGDVKNSDVKKIEVIDSKLIATYKDEKIYTSYKETQSSIYEVLKDSGVDPNQVEIEIKDTTGGAIWFNILSNVLPLLLMVGFFLFLIRQARGAQDTLFSFGQSKAKLFAKDSPKVTFKDVAGVDEAKEEMSEVVDFLKNSMKYRALGARTPKGVLLIGPSGTGKTLLARALAGEANVPFFSMAGSEFMEMLVGVGASRVRDLFNTAKKNSPAIIFIDEIDAIGRVRSVGVMGGHDEREQTLNQILVEMDGFTPNENVVVVAATNRGDLLDPALLRPGRFDRRTVLDLPDMVGREAILKIHIQGKPIENNVKWDQVAKRTVGFSGADLENMLNEAAIQAAKKNKKAIDADDIEEAATKVKLGPEKKRLQSDLDRKMTAYHEAGHGIVTHELPNMDIVHRISIVSRGMTLGYTLIPPQKDRIHETRTHLVEQITSMLGGRAAEELIFNEMTTGAASDIDKATSLAKDMVIEFGMSSLGPINFGSSMDVTEWGGRYMNEAKISQEMQNKIDNEIKKIIDEAYRRAEDILKRNKKKLDIVAAELINRETLEAEDFEKLVGCKKTVKPSIKR
ncbi:cell division protein FtsH [Candidatus Gottesmanbacteria bacterium CG23_combo_of_CG06-09_8_20_14_all_37_19]|uniref:ATP-dependent zinc metalloprotease FtsH n=2 Tax=Candidatus Gottesmaniibacteriota TaxID=1752720 RepID=A0A1J4TTA4_9BACT|nr:MAG: cell division protein FtsH [Candidatus Gottesmanbacteria bacterium CG1_02_37_22]PIP32730.1 MAG: cell division protein FtsH [Candidatus Gottesmanbacteria bacterium CG23_combo_of_CG06-09_8_20_14_all_37_19]